MSSKTWLAMYSVLSLLLIGGAAAFVFSFYGKANEAKSSWSNRKNSIETLERRKIPPNEKNVKELVGRVTEYETSIQKLYTDLEAFQKKLDTDLTQVEFNEAVTAKTLGLRKDAKNEGFDIYEASNFMMGFNVYSNSFAPQPIVRYLDYELGAIDHLIRKMMEVGVETLDFFSRDPIQGEENGPKEQGVSTVHKYPVRLGFKTDHESFVRFMNALASDKEYFYVVRILKVNNEKKDAPLKQQTQQSLIYVNKITGEPATMDQLSVWGVGLATEDEVDGNAMKDGFVKGGADARILMGEETMDVFMVIDITRFLAIDEVEIEQEEKKPRRRGRK